MSDKKPTPYYYEEIAREIQAMADAEPDPDKKHVLTELAASVEKRISWSVDAMTAAAGFAELGLHYRLDNMLRDIEQVRDDVRKFTGYARNERDKLEAGLHEATQKIDQVLGLLREHDTMMRTAAQNAGNLPTEGDA